MRSFWEFFRNFRWKTKYEVNPGSTGGKKEYDDSTEGPTPPVQIRERNDSYPEIPSLANRGCRTSIYVGAQEYMENQHWRKYLLLGSGQFGECFQAMDIVTGTLMAVKQVKVPVNEISVSREQLKEEIELLGKLNHKNIVRILGATEETSHFNIFLEWMPGGSISSLLQKFGCFHELVIIKYTEQVLMALEYLHSNKILHRDLKGANILVDGTGQRVRISDFGTATILKTQETRVGEFKGQITGTLPFMAPEVVRGDSYGRSSDIWSVGCVIIEMATAQIPWHYTDNPPTNYFQLLYLIAQATRPPPIPTTLSASTRRLVSKCLRLDASARPSATQLLADPCFAILKTYKNFTKIYDICHHNGGIYQALSDSDSVPKINGFAQSRVPGSSNGQHAEICSEEEAHDEHIAEEEEEENPGEEEEEEYPGEEEEEYPGEEEEEEYPGEEEEYPGEEEDNPGEEEEEEDPGEENKVGDGGGEGLKDWPSERDEHVNPQFPNLMEPGEDI